MTLRRVLMTIVIAFTAYFLVRGAIIATIVPNALHHLVTVALWLATVAIVLWVPGRDPRAKGVGNRSPSRLPLWAAIVVVVAITVSQSQAIWASGDHIHDPIMATMFGANGEVLTILMVRRRPSWAWGGVAVVAALGIAAMGVGEALGRGLLGTFLWVGIAQLMLWSVDRAYLDTARLVRLQQASAAWQASQDARRAERRERVRFALAVAGPVLTRVVLSGGRLDDAERTDALTAEGTLRDELRAHRLLDDDVRAAIRMTRDRGASVTVIDDDALTDLGDDALERVRAVLAEALRATDADRIIVRTTPDPDTAVTIVGRRAAPRPDEDALALWQEIPRP
ncbi:hypothetical protein [Microbacterium halotolerans]|uniref:hypothetical protein n=1 Tax=Microbacterium halotolerans TaxID=246613 RepID=UPI000E6AB244|nr:hypothetical protein [Microbacterium halotolerans]